MNLLELRGELRGATVIARAQHKIQQLLERRRVPRRAAQNRFQQTDRLLRQAIAGEQIDVGQRLRDEFLGVFVERCFGTDRRRWWRCTATGVQAAH